MSKVARKGRIMYCLRWVKVSGLAFLLLWAGLVAPLPVAASADRATDLPRFTEEREAAALFFVRKHVPEMLPLLDQLKKTDTSKYEREISYVFHVTELLADLRDNPARHDLELQIWIAQNKAQVLVARLVTLTSPQREKSLAQLKSLAERLVQLDVQVLELKERQLQQQLNEVRSDLSQLRQHQDQQVQERLQQLLRSFQQARRKE
jgi:hypothetical protein